MGVVEDLIAVSFATDSKINFNVIFVVFLVALPFAFISEIVVDHPLFWKKIFKNVEDEVHKVEKEVEKGI